jgi:nitroreductase
MSAKYDILNSIITNRRTIKPPLMNGKIIDDSLITQLLQLANWAPTHANTEPWRFIVYTPATKSNFCKAHAELYKEHTNELNFLLATYQKMEKMGDNASHIIVAYTQKGNNTKIPIIEEIAATSAAIENILLGASALNIAAYWGTGGMVHHPVFKSFLQLHENDVVLGTIYLGYSNETKEGKRITPIEHKTTWFR